MKKVFFLSLVILCAFALNACKEKSDPEPQKRMRLSELKTEDGISMFSYNEAGCLIKLFDKSDGSEDGLFFDYNSENKLIKCYIKDKSGELGDGITYEYQEDVIICRYDKEDSYEKYYTNSEGYMVKYAEVVVCEEQEIEDEIIHSTYIWEQGNCVRSIGESQHAYCKFDDKKNPFQFQYLKFISFTQEMASKNNRLEYNCEEKSSDRNKSSLLTSRLNFFRFFEPKNRNSVNQETFEYKYNSMGYPTLIKNYSNGELYDTVELTYETY